MSSSNNKLSENSTFIIISLIASIIAIVVFITGRQTIWEFLSDPTAIPSYPIAATVNPSDTNATMIAIAIAIQQTSVALRQTPIPSTVEPFVYPTYTPYPAQEQPTVYIPPPITIVVVSPTSVPPTAIPPTTMLSSHTVTVYSQPIDGALGVVVCNKDWSTCRSESAGNTGDASMEVATIGTDYYADKGFNIGRVFLFFDTSQIPNNATITSATLYLYTGQWLVGNTIMHVTASYTGNPLSINDYSRIGFDSGGYANFSNPFTWTNIPLNTLALGWIDKGGVTKLALMHDNDLKNIAPSIPNNILIATAESQSTAPYLVINYLSP